MILMKTKHKNLIILVLLIVIGYLGGKCKAGNDDTAYMIPHAISDHNKSEINDNHSNQQEDTNDENENNIEDMTFTAATGELDTTFDSDGQVYTNLNVDSINITTMTIQPDGKILAAGHVDTLEGSAYSIDVLILRYNKDGTLDNSFNHDGIVIFDIFYFDTISAITLQQDGKILVSGLSTNNNPNFNENIVYLVLIRFQSDGSLDSTFGENGIVKFEAIRNFHKRPTAIEVQSDGRILVAGDMYNGNLYNQDFLLIRFLSNGRLDYSFGINGVVFANPGCCVEVYDIKLQSCCSLMKKL